jgi:hypothetical protein
MFTCGGQFWPVPLGGGPFGCGLVLGTEREPGYGSRTWFVAGLLDWVGTESHLDWVGTESPTVDSIAGAALLGSATRTST